MRLGSPFDTLHEALASATATDLPGVEYWQRDWVAYNKLKPEEKAKIRTSDGGPGLYVTRRPMSDEVAVEMFPQTWGSTACGYGGVGGAAMTPAYTVLVEYHNTVCVYFGCGRLAYKIDRSEQSDAGRGNFEEDRKSQFLVSVAQSSKYR